MKPEAIAEPETKTGAEEEVKTGAEEQETKVGAEEEVRLPEEKTGEETGKETGAEDEPPQPTPEEEIQRLREENLRFQEREKLLREISEKKGEPKSDPWYVSDEQYKQLGTVFKDDPSRMARWVVSLVKSAVEWSQGNVDGRYGEFFSDRQVDSALRDMSKESKFADIRKYSSDILDFVRDYPVNMRNDRRVLEKAFTYARGLAISQQRRAAGRGDELRRTAAKGTQAPAGQAKKVKGEKKLEATPQTRAMYEKFGKRLFKTYEDFLKYGEKE